MTEVIGVAEAKRTFADLIDRVGAGERVLVTRHGKPAVAIVAPEEIDLRLRSGRPTGFAALAGALADVEGFADVMDDVVRSRDDARDRPGPKLE